MLTTPVKILEWTPQYSVYVVTIDQEHQTSSIASTRRCWLEKEQKFWRAFLRK
jgi:hypothetical protein